MVMVNHAAYPLTADPKRPATVSKFWMQTVLRKRLGYRGMVVSDDLEMGGVTIFMPIAEAAIALLDNDAERHAMRKRAYLHSRGTTWPVTVMTLSGRTVSTASKAGEPAAKTICVMP